MKILRWSVGKEDDFKKLPAFLSSKKELGLSSQKKARQLLETGKCSVNGYIRTFSSTIVRAGDEIVVVQDDLGVVVKAEVPIIYDKSGLFVIEKPPGLQCEQAVLEQVLKRPCFMVHRLDKETSGLVIVADNLSMAERAHKLFAQREVVKKYLAIVDGQLTPKNGSICFPLRMQSRIGSSIYWGVAKTGGKSAWTDYEAIFTKKNASLVVLTPHTGRTHQLRVHMVSIGHPILGDYHYADRFVCALRPNRQLLHAWKLNFTHPLLNEGVHCTGAIPKDFQESAARIFGDTWEQNL